jgi:hypothetical protein
MRTLMRAGAIALAASSALLGSAIAAQAAPGDGISVEVNQLVLDPGTSGHTGSIRIVITNNSTETYSGGVAITEPIADSFTSAISGAEGCVFGSTPDHRRIDYCALAGEIAPGGTAVVTQGYQSPAKPRKFAQIAPEQGVVEVGDASASFPALFRSTTGSLANPRPYVQATTAALNVKAPAGVTLTRQSDGTYAGSVKIKVKNKNDAPQYGLGAQIAVPAGLDEWPAFDPSVPCVLGGSLPVPEGGVGLSCDPSGVLNEGQTETFVWRFHAPADAAPGVLGTATAEVDIQGDGTPQTDGANIASFTLTIAG